MKKIILSLFLLGNSIFLASSLNQTTTKTVHFENSIKTGDLFVIGGEITNTDTCFGIFKVQQNNTNLLIEYHSKNIHIADIYQYLKNILTDLKNNHDISISTACFAIPGIARGDIFLHPHLPWNTSNDKAQHADKSQRGLDKQKFINICQLQNVYFINDFQALALGTQLIDTSSFVTLQTGKEQFTKPKLVIGAGNGLGASLLIWDNQLNRYVPFQLNYSFTEFGAQSDLELAFFNFMKNQTGNIAWGKVLGAGAGGIKLMYKFFDELDKNKKSQHKLYKCDNFIDYENYIDIFKTCDKSIRCQDCVNLFINLYARIIRNASYAQAALGGVYITNTVAQENPDLFTTHEFLKKITNLDEIVLDEGSRKYLEAYLAEIPFYVVTNKKVQLFCAAALCMEPNLIRN